MKTLFLTAEEIRKLKARYRKLAARIGSFESLSQGSVMPQPPGAWRWTRKVGGKTVSLGLTAQQAGQLKHAIANHRELENMIKEMREITQKLVLRSGKPPAVPTPADHPKRVLS